MAFKNRKKMSLEEAKTKARKKLGVLDMRTHTEGKDKLVLFYGSRGGHNATYNRTTKEFWFIR